MSTWVVVGSSLSVIEHADAVLDAFIDATTIAANAAIKLFEGRSGPDYFIAIDECAGIELQQHIEAKVAQGTRFMSYSKSNLVNNIRGIGRLPGFEVNTPMPSILLDMGPLTTTYVPGEIVFAQYCGLAAMQYAIREGATELVIVGCDGYPGDRPMVDFPVVTFDGKCGDSMGMVQTRTVIEPFMRSMVAQCPDVEFVQFGRPLYTVDAPNYTVALEIVGGMPEAVA